MAFYLGSVKMTKNYWCILILLLVLCSSCAVSGKHIRKQSISPIDMGLNKAQTGEERYNVLLLTHKMALQNGLYVDYSGITKIDLIIPKGAESIPLGAYNDFAGVVLNVTNNNQDLFLFTYANKSESVDVSNLEIDKGVFRRIPQLKKGERLLAIEDQTPWIDNRKGYSYGHYRRDIMLLKKGKAQNKTVMPYGNNISKPICRLYELKDEVVTFSNITLNRSDNSTKKTFLCFFRGLDNLLLKSVVLNTPQNDMVNDVAIQVLDATNVRFEDVRINGTYSKSNHSGYGISMNNIWNFYAYHLYGNGKWGVFGNNNINVATLEDCEINRFDIHCYGRDVTFSNVKFFKWYNQFSSVFGDIRFNDCVFKSFTPVLYEPSYNAINEHRISFNNCTFYADIDHNSLIKVGAINTERNSRPELNKKCWPQLFVENLKVISTSWKVSDLFLFNTSTVEKGAMLDTLAPIVINGIEVNYLEKSDPIKVSVSNMEVESRGDVKVEVRNIYIKEKTKGINNVGDDSIYVNIKKHN